MNKGDGDLYVISDLVDWATPTSATLLYRLTLLYQRESLEHADWASTRLSAALPALLRDSDIEGHKRCSELHFCVKPHVTFTRIAQILENQGADLLAAAATWQLKVISLKTGQSLAQPSEVSGLQVALSWDQPAAKATCRSAPLTSSTLSAQAASSSDKALIGGAYGCRVGFLTRER